MLGAYLFGVARVWRRAGAGRGVSSLELAAFVAGAIALFASSVWPLDALGEWSRVAHMAQHMLLLAFVPPLLLAGQPLAVIAHALPRRAAGWLHHRLRPLHLRAAAALALASAAQLAVMGLWHLPAATAAARGNDGVHWFTHGSFLLAGFWLGRPLPPRARSRHRGGSGAGGDRRGDDCRWVSSARC